MIYEYFRATGAHEAVQGLSDLFTVSLQDDDVQEFDVRWDHALLSVSEMPSDPILEGLFKSNLQNSVQLRTAMALYDQEVARNNGTPNYQQLKTAVKLHIDQMMRNRNFRGQGDVEERGSVTTGHKGEAYEGECFQLKHTDNVPKETHVVSIMTSLASGNKGRGQTRKGRSSSPASHAKAKRTEERNKNPHRDHAINRITRETRVKFHAGSDSVKIRHVSSGILPCV